ncbi:DMT family transporter [Basilea psittacipulmonis]|uniref:EamA domain-containing protein n=1 Tax=Basilea psittacipulmonis DSM 24701 TaxID=1072685 RepID=A0A077DCR7_9BURK|nr:DMT family transporter [Basilea psittacipulmonis]AIL31976.1 hypothetical protein IX83_00350 [Basilea psittacipulmonis DSM 24701]
MSDKRILGLSRQEWALVLVTIFWGSTFVVVKNAMQWSGPFSFVAMRFLMAGVVTFLIFRRDVLRITKKELFSGVLIGAMVFMGYGFQTVGLQTILSSQSAFLTALYVPIVPFLQWIVTKKAPSKMNFLGIALAFAGTIYITGGGITQISLSFGELMTVLAAIALSFEILLFSFFGSKVNVRGMTVIQLFTVSLLGFIVAPLSGEAMPEFSWVLLGSIAFMGVGSGVVQFTMAWAQSSISATRATLIYTGEPIWGAVAGRIVGERLGMGALFGALLIFLGVLVSELKFKFSKADKRE